MLMTIQVRSTTGELINGAQVFVNGNLIGVTPNAVTNVSTFVGSSCVISAKCEGYADSFSIPAQKEIKVAMLVIGIVCTWIPLLWCYGPTQTQTITLQPLY